jgi:hypothetical protein
MKIAKRVFRSVLQDRPLGKFLQTSTAGEAIVSDVTLFEEWRMLLPRQTAATHRPGRG